MTKSALAMIKQCIGEKNFKFGRSSREKSEFSEEKSGKSIEIV